MNKNDKEFFVQKIRTQYTEKENTQLEALKKLDTKVKKPANVFAYVFGSIAAIIMGSGMSLVMTDIGQTLVIQNTMVTASSSALSVHLWQSSITPCSRRFLLPAAKNMQKKLLH